MGVAKPLLSHTAATPVADRSLESHDRQALSESDHRCHDARTIKAQRPAQQTIRHIGAGAAVPPNAAALLVGRLWDEVDGQVNVLAEDSAVDPMFRYAGLGQLPVTCGLTNVEWRL